MLILFRSKKDERIAYNKNIYEPYVVDDDTPITEKILYALACKASAKKEEFFDVPEPEAIADEVAPASLIPDEKEAEEEITYYGIEADCGFKASWKAAPTSFFYNSPLLQDENGFKDIANAKLLLSTLSKTPTLSVTAVDTKIETVAAPLLFNLRDLQNECEKIYGLTPEQTQEIALELFELQLITYPLTDAQVLSTQIADKASFILNGLAEQGYRAELISKIMQNNWQDKAKEKPYTDDEQISKHHAIIPTGSTMNDVSTLDIMHQNVYIEIVSRFLSIFFPATEYDVSQVTLKHSLYDEFIGTARTIKKYGYLEVIDTGKTQVEYQQLTIGQTHNASFHIVELHTVQ